MKPYRSKLPATLYSEIVPMTKEQEAKVEELEKLGWICVTPPDSVFNGALLMEAPPDGSSHYVYPDGTVK